jgi:hypothetical protein
VALGSREWGTKHDEPRLYPDDLQLVGVPVVLDLYRVRGHLHQDGAEVVDRHCHSRLYDGVSIKPRVISEDGESEVLEVIDDDYGERFSA